MQSPYRRVLSVLFEDYHKRRSLVGSPSGGFSAFRVSERRSAVLRMLASVLSLIQPAARFSTV